MSSQVNVRFVNEGDSALRQTVSVHVGALRLEGGSATPNHTQAASDKDDDRDVSTSQYTTDSGGDDESLFSTSTKSPQLSWDLVFLVLFSGSGWGIIAVLFGLAFLFGVPVAMILIGSVYLGIESCFEERIAILLIIGGILSILSVLTRAAMNDAVGKGKSQQDQNHSPHHHYHGHPHHHPRRWGHDEPIQPRKKMTWLRFLHGLIILVDCVWVVVTSIFVYRIQSIVILDDDESETYCARTLYLFAFIYLTVVWAIFAASLACLVAGMVWRKCVCACSRGTRR